MKEILAYFYKTEDCPGIEWVSGGLSFPSIRQTDNPSEASVFVLPNDLCHYTNEQLHALPYLNGNERRHVFLAITENPERTVGIPAIIFRCDHNQHIRDAGDLSTMSWAWGSDDFYDPDAEFERDVVFQGQAGATGLTIRACKSIKESGLNAHINILDTFYGIYETKQPDYAKQLRAQFVKTLKTSRLSLAASTKPEGVIRYRFYEAMAAGRVPVLIGDASIRPLEDRIPYDKCTLRIAEKDVDRTGEILKEFLATHSDGQLLDMGKIGYDSWREWLDHRVWARSWERLTIEKLKELDA